MTYEEFLDLLSKTPRGWFLDAHNGVRLRTPYRHKLQCPISSLGDAPVCAFAAIATALGIELRMRNKIVDAADNSDDCNKRVRADLLRACGLEVE